MNPDKFKIRKFGVSDVIAITAAGKTAFYYVDKEALVKFNGFLAPKAEGSYLILNEDGYQIEGQTDTWKVIDEKNVQEQRFVQLVCEQTKKQKRRLTKPVNCVILLTECSAAPQFHTLSRVVEGSAR